VGAAGWAVAAVGGFGCIAGATGGGGFATAGGAEGALASSDACDGVIGFVRTVQASSSNPPAAGAAELDLGGGATAGVEEGRTPGCADCGELEDWTGSPIALKSTVFGGRLLLGSGLRRRVAFNPPPGSVKSWGAVLGAPFSSTEGCLGFRKAMALVTLMMSPSRKPRERIVASVMSGRMASSILSRSNEAA
jgi:hypothetical protein